MVISAVCTKEYNLLGCGTSEARLSNDEAMRAAMGGHLQPPSLRGFDSVDDTSIPRRGSQRRSVINNPLHILLSKASKVERVAMPEANICKILETALE